MLDLGKFTKEVHALAKEKGWHDDILSKDRIAALLCLIHSEVSEALECLRSNDMPLRFSQAPSTYGKPEGFEAEIADVLIRTLDLCGLLGIDAEEACLTKHAYNKTRTARHGGKAL